MRIFGFQCNVIKLNLVGLLKLVYPIRQNYRAVVTLKEDSSLINKKGFHGLCY